MVLQIIERAVSDVHYIDHAQFSIVKVVVGSYVEALSWTHGILSTPAITSYELIVFEVLSLACSVTAFIGSLFLRQHKL